MKHIVGEYSIVNKVDVSNVQESVRWYRETLDLIPQPEFDAPTWAQLKFIDLPNYSIGLNYSPAHVGTGGEALTIVVKDIQKARQELISRGVDMSPVSNVGGGVSLAFFTDPDGNKLGLRQQPTT